VSYKVLTIPLFVKQAKRLSKKYPSLKADLSALIDLLSENPQSGKALGKSFYKIRLAITSKNKGKSSGARIITYVKILVEKVYLVAIYDKSELDDLTERELNEIFKLLE
jgi:hypothetical protein